MELKPYMIIHIKDDDGIDRNVIILPVTKKDIKRGINASHTGLFGFRGFWYKGNGTKWKSYGKIYDISDYNIIDIVRQDICGLNKKQLKELLK